MQLTFLGTGSAMPTGDRFQTGLLVTGEGADPLLVDCGSGALHGLAATDVGYEGVDTVLLTHHHLDHVSDLLPLLKARWLAGAGETTVAGPPGTRRLVDDLLDVHDYLADHVDVTVRDVDAGTVDVAGRTVEARATEHSMYCLAYRFGDHLAFSADTEADPDLAAFADGVEVFVHDCSFPDDVDVANHPTPSQLGEALAGHDYGTVVLTHLYPHTDGRHREMQESVEARWDGDVRLASDGLTLEC